jgi:aspartyl-tRNA(Asn)/glutamyl-tRNA(Gln) amidotransferase subunit B
VKVETIIGLEIHAELLTASKIFCACSTEFGAEPNSQVCPICLGMPGTLPVINERAVEYAVKAGLALNCEIAPYSKWDRKQYFYPDLPKAYQISQYDLPLSEHGLVQFTMEDKLHQVRILRVHLEEEAGKLVHSGDSLHGSDYSLVDYNRGGIPLIEIVTAPDLRSPEASRLFLERLRTILRYIGVSDCKMQEGSLRCDANINLHIDDDGRICKTPIVEVKNLNSFRAVERALNYEVQRQYQEYLDGVYNNHPGGKVTAGWNDARGFTYVQRKKEQADDYRYFPDPDLLPVVLERALVEQWEGELPELPALREERFIKAYALPAYDAAVLTSSRVLADYFEAVAKELNDAKLASNWMMSEVLRLINEEGQEPDDVLPTAKVTPVGLAALLQMLKIGKVNGNIAKEVFEEMWHTGHNAVDIVASRGLEQISDSAELASLVNTVLAANTKVVDDILKGKTGAIGFLVGQVMKATKGKANPKMVNDMIQVRLQEMKG